MPPDPLTQALRALVSGEATALAAEFVTVPSHLGVEHVEEAMVAALESRLAAAGLVVTRQEVLPGRSNIIARLPGREDGPALMLNGHLDTVQPGSRMPPSGPPISRTMPLPAEVSELALLSSEPVPTTAGVRACWAGAYNAIPELSAASAASVASGGSRDPVCPCRTAELTPPTS